MTEYIIEPLDTDPEAIFNDFTEFMRQYFPDWEASEGQLDVIIARYFSMQTAFTADMASRVLRAIFRYFGNSLAGIPPLPGSAAQALIQFDVLDPSTPPIEHTLPFGSLVGLTDADGDLQMFSTMDDLVVDPGDVVAEVVAQAIELGSVSNNIGGTVDLVEGIDWISAARVVGVSSGGSDPENDDVYVQRLTENLALMAPRPILAQDYAVFARNVPGVWRSAVIDNFGSGVNEVQRITSNYLSGVFNLSFLGQTTEPIPAVCTTARLSSAMSALSNFDSTDADFTGGPLPDAPIEIHFKGRFGFLDLALLTASTSGLFDGSSFAITQVTAGAPYVTTVANSIAVSGVDEEGGPLPDTIRDQMLEYLGLARTQNFVINWVDPAYHPVDVTYVARAVPGQDADSVKTLVDTALQQYLSAKNWGIYPTGADNRTWVLQPNVRYLELTTIVENVPGVDFTESLTFNIDHGAMSSADKNFGQGPFSLTTVGVITGTVNQAI